jgi:hypothetical protein
MIHILSIAPIASQIPSQSAIAPFEKSAPSRQTFTYPFRCLLYQNFKAWMGQLISWPGIEGILNCPLDKRDPDITHDILESKILQDFIGPDERLFLRSSEGG